MANSTAQPVDMDTFKGTERREASILRVKVWALARELDESLAMLAELRARENAG